MLFNYLKTALRNILRNKFYSVINILGLSVGIAVFLLIFFYVEYEYNFDKHFPQAEQICRITTNMYWENGDIQYTAVSANAVAPALKKDYPEVIAATRFRVNPSVFVEKQLVDTLNAVNKNFEEVYFIDSSFFKVFQIDFERGNSNMAFGISNSIILSASMAEKYFQKEDPVGRSIQINNDKIYNVTAIFEDIPQNSHFNFEFLINASDDPDFKTDQWRKMDTYTYALLDKNTDLVEFEKKLVDFKITYQEPYKNLIDFKVQPMLDIHLRSQNDFEAAKTSNKQMILIIFGIAILILIIAAMNYMNLSIAQSLIRSKEVGLRKVVGATKGKIIAQFMGESFLMTFIALFSAVVITEVLLPVFNSFTYSHLAPDYLNSSWKLLLLVILTAVISGSYPAFYVSSFQPARVLKGRSIGTSGDNWLRKVLVVFQFTISVILLIGIGIFFSQFNYIKNKDLGFRKDVMLNVYFWNDSIGSFSQQFKNEIVSIPGIEKICLSDHVPGSEPWYEHFWPEGFESHMPMRTLNVSPEYIPSLDLKLVSGRNFSNNCGLDTAACILNEAALEHFGWDMNNAIGKTIKYNFSQSWDEIIASKVIGVVKDYHYQSLHQRIEPVVFTMHKKFYPIVTMQLDKNNITQTLEQVKSAYELLGYPFPFDYEFLDKEVEEMYITDQKLGKILVWFTILSIFIACLGLLGLSSFSVEKRTKEIGIRKVFGASVMDVLVVFTKEFSILVLIASIIATPIGWYIMQQWLNNFAYHSKISWWIYFNSAVLVFFVAMLTVGFQSYKYAQRNPAEVLKYE